MRTGMKKRVLLVDDDFAVLAGLAGVLVSEGYSVVHAADADEAIEKFREDRSFDISKASNELGYRPVVSLREGIRQLAVWYRANGYLS